MVNAYRAEMNRNEADPARLGITIDMIMRQDKNLRESKGYGIAQMAEHTAILLGYTTLSRVSEYGRSRASPSIISQNK